MFATPVQAQLRPRWAGLSSRCLSSSAAPSSAHQLHAKSVWMPRTALQASSRQPLLSSHDASAPASMQPALPMHQSSPMAVPGARAHSRLVAAQARRGRDGRGSSDYGDYDYDDGQGRGSREATQGGIRFSINNTEVNIPPENMWQLAVPALMVLGLAAILGPLIIGIAMAAVAVGAAMSVGAFAMSFFWLPFMMMGFFTFLMFGGVFGAFATFGLGLLLPKIMSLAIALGGVALGWAVVSNVLPKKSSASAAAAGSKGSGKAGARRGYDQDGPVVAAEARDLKDEDDDDKEVRRMAAELKDFDTLLAEREEEKRVEEWRKRKMGR